MNDIVSRLTSVRANVGQPERIGSVIVGAGLTVLGFTRHTLGGLALIAAGATLIARGVRGSCLLYRALGINHTKAIPWGEKDAEAMDLVEQASMDSFPASDAPSRNSVS